MGSRLVGLHMKGELCRSVVFYLSPPVSSIHGIFQARVLEWGAIAFSDLKAEESLKVYKKH